MLDKVRTSSFSNTVSIDVTHNTGANFHLGLAYKRVVSPSFGLTPSLSYTAPFVSCFVLVVFPQFTQQARIWHEISALASRSTQPTRQVDREQKRQKEFQNVMNRSTASDKWEEGIGT